ncbi:MAG: hypothetical protein MJ237_01425 [bacterium]|nr:hypothetical protein [bacterium]
MGMDGLSMANTGLIKESTSAEVNAKTGQVVQSDPKNDAKQIQTLETNRAIREKNEEEQGNKQEAPEQNTNGEEESFEDSFVQENSTNDQPEFDIEDLDNPNKNFYVKLNAKDDIIELYESNSDRLIETISGNELQNLVKKLNMASGVFVNKKV